VGSDRSTRGHWISRDARRLQRLAQTWIEPPYLDPGADQQDLDLSRFGDHPREIAGHERDAIVRLPTVDARRQTQQRPAVRHVGKAEAAIAICVDRRAAGKM